MLKLALLTLCAIPSFADSESIKKVSNEEFQGIEWIEENRDKEGCILRDKILDKNGKCPLSFEPQIRPMLIGTFDKIKTEAKRKEGRSLCCYNWVWHGNR